MYASSVLCFLVFTCRLCMYPHTRGPVVYPLSIKSIAAVVSIQVDEDSESSGPQERINGGGRSKKTGQ
jgi:hypothetical protein